MRFSLLFLSTLSTSSASASLVSTGFTLKLNNISYYAPPHVVASIATEDIRHSFTPGTFAAVTVVTTDDAGFGLTELSAVKADYKQIDDVWQAEFSDLVYLQYSGTGTFGSDFAKQEDVITRYCNLSTKIPNGPYFMTSDGSIYEAHRLYADSMGAFSETVTSTPDGTFSVLPANVEGQNLAIAVPSRLYFTKTTAKPLAGIRIGIKDIFDISGIRTSSGNRAWYHLYPPAVKTAQAVQNLINAGAIVVGKTKTSQFANGAEATGDWVDYHSPFNPRGDGYQETSSSSAGSGAAVAAYPWLDIALGSDTGGSIRGPAHYQGIYGNRPSHGLVSLENVMPLAPQLDTAGLLTRNPVLWGTAAKALYGSNINIRQGYPKEILTMEFPELADSEVDATLIKFLDALTSYLSAKRTAFNTADSWTLAKPLAPSLKEMLNTTYPTIISKEQIKNVRDPFYRDYAAANDGRQAFIDPTSKVRWDFGDSTASTIEEAVANKTIFMDWFQSEILVLSEQTCSNKLLVKAGHASIIYRNEYLNSPKVPFGFSSQHISPFSEVPDMVVPIGQWGYFSEITNHTEVLPITVNFMAAKGCDGMIFSLVEDLFHAGILKVSQPGRSIETGGEILYKR